MDVTEQRIMESALRHDLAIAREQAKQLSKVYHNRLKDVERDRTSNTNTFVAEQAYWLKRIQTTDEAIEAMGKVMVDIDYAHFDG